MVVGDHDADPVGLGGHRASRGNRMSSRAPPPGERDDRQLPTEGAHPLLDHVGALAALVELRVAQGPVEGEPLPVVVHHQPPARRGAPEAHQHLLRVAVLAHVLQRLLHDAPDLTAHAGREVHVLDGAVEDGPDPRVAPEAGHGRVEEAHQLLRRDLDGLQPLHGVAQLEDLAAQQALHPREVRRERQPGLVRAPAHDVDLHLDRDERLDRAVVQLARDARPLHGPDARAHAAQHETGLDDAPQLAHHALREAERLLARALGLRVDEDEASPPVAPVPEARHGQPPRPEAAGELAHGLPRHSRRVGLGPARLVEGQDSPTPVHLLGLPRVGARLEEPVVGRRRPELDGLGRRSRGGPGRHCPQPGPAARPLPRGNGHPARAEEAAPVAQDGPEGPGEALRAPAGAPATRRRRPRARGRDAGPRGAIAGPRPPSAARRRPSAGPPSSRAPRARRPLERRGWRPRGPRSPARAPRGRHGRPGLARAAPG